MKTLEARQLKDGMVLALPMGKYTKITRAWQGSRYVQCTTDCGTHPRYELDQEVTVETGERVTELANSIVEALKVLHKSRVQIVTENDGVNLKRLEELEEQVWILLDQFND